MQSNDRISMQIETGLKLKWKFFFFFCCVWAGFAFNDDDDDINSILTEMGKYTA